MRRHILLRLGGTLHGGPQTWSVGFRFLGADGGDPGGIAGIENKVDSWRDALRDLYQGQVWHPYFGTMAGGPTRLTQARCSIVGTNGKEEYVSLLEGSPLAIGNGVAKQTQQVCVTVSLLSGRPGASNRGRVYLPAIGASLSGNGLLADGDRDSLSSAMVDFIKKVENAGATIINPGLRLSIISSRGDKAATVQLVKVGNRLDIQRRRADKQQEQYGVVNIAR